MKKLFTLLCLSAFVIGGTACIADDHFHYFNTDPTPIKDTPTVTPTANPVCHFNTSECIDAATEGKVKNPASNSKIQKQMQNLSDQYQQRRTDSKNSKKK